MNADEVIKEYKEAYEEYCQVCREFSKVRTSIDPINPTAQEVLALFKAKKRMSVASKKYFAIRNLYVYTMRKLNMNPDASKKAIEAIERKQIGQELINKFFGSVEKMNEAVAKARASGAAKLSSEEQEEKEAEALDITPIQAEHQAEKKTKKSELEEAASAAIGGFFKKKNSQELLEKTDEINLFPEEAETEEKENSQE